MIRYPAGLKSIGYRAFRFACRHRRAWLVRHLARLGYVFHREWENRNFDFHSNGEEWCLRQLQNLNFKCVFDVGANQGEWTQLARKYFPAATIHSFEIIPRTFAVLKENVGAMPQMVLNSCGLSDSDGIIPVHFSSEFHFRASAYAMPDVEAQQTVQAPVMRGAEYTKKHKIEKIDFLKIDVEGMEGAVLRGFERLLSQRQIRVIQFEYNVTNIVSGFLLRDFYKLFEPFGYKIGKIYPNYVEFRSYQFEHENFFGPNFLAIRNDDLEVQRLLS